MAPAARSSSPPLFFSSHVQGVGGPCCARILTTWFAGKERGTYWGMWNIAHNLGGFAAPLIAGGFAKSMGWQWGMWAPGIIGVSLVTVFIQNIKEEVREPLDLLDEIKRRDPSLPGWLNDGCIAEVAAGGGALRELAS